MAIPFKHTYIKWNNLVSGLYLPAENQRANKKVAIVFAKGALSAGDLGKNDACQATLALGIPLFVPDYYGHFRSGGKFTPENCAKTIIDCVDIATGKHEIYDSSKQKKTSYYFNDVIIIGSSFGGWIPWYINNFFSKKRIKRIGLIAPFFDFENQAVDKRIPEEDTHQFLKLGKEIFKNTYRGIESSTWKSFLLAKKRDMNPMRNLDPLLDSQIAVVHGKNDRVINHEKSENLYNLLKEKNPTGKYFLKLMKNTGHTSDKIDEKMKFILDRLLTKEEKSY